MLGRSGTRVLANNLNLTGCRVLFQEANLCSYQLISQSLGLALQRWQGNYKGIDATWLRWATLEGELLPTPEEQERLRADSERLRAEQAESQLQQTVRNLLAEGMGVEQVARLTGLSVGQVEELSS